MAEEKIIRLSDILTKGEIDELIDFVKKMKGVSPTALEFTKGLKELFAKHREELLRRAVLPEFLAYATSYLLSKIPERARIDFLKLEKAKAKKSEELI